MSTQSRAPQGKNTCPDGKAYFACSSSFRGCCSKDPCALGFCPDKLNFNRDPRDPADDEPTETTLFPPMITKTEDKKSQETPTETMTDDKSKPPRETPPPLPPLITLTTMTDSGITHTIPNNSVVTVILHTTITTKRPSAAASSTDAAMPTDAGGLGTSTDMNGATATGPASPAETTAGASSDDTAGGFSTAAIIGVAVGGAVLIAILGLIAMFVRRRRRERSDDASEVYSSGFNEENGAVRREEVPEEKHYPPPVSTHTTGTQGSSDPFAPFGGRADDPYRPHSGTFEMDGTSVAPVELPVHDGGHGPGQTPSANLKNSPAPRLDPVQEGAVSPADPRANLNSVKTEGGKPAYINHWNQYKSLGQTDQN